MLGANQRTKQLREKIAELSKINPNTYISKEQLQEKKKIFCKNEKTMTNPYQSQNGKVYNSINKPKDGSKSNLPKKVFAFDTNYYKTLHSDYSNVSTSIPKQTNIQPSKLIKKQVTSQRQELNDSPIKNLIQPKPSLISLQPVVVEKPPSPKQKGSQQKQALIEEKKTIVPSNEPVQSQSAPTPIAQSTQQKVKDQLINIFAKGAENKQNEAQITINLFNTKPINIFNKKEDPSAQNVASKVVPFGFSQPTGSLKPSFSFAMPQNKKAIDQPKKSYSQPLAQTSKVQIKSIFDRSNQGSLNLNAAKPVTILNNFQSQNKTQEAQSAFSLKPTPSFTLPKVQQKPQKSQQAPVEIAKPMEIEPKNEQKAFVFNGSVVNSQPNNFFSKNNSGLPFFNPNAPNLFTSNGHATNKPSPITPFFNPIAKKQEKVQQKVAEPFKKENASSIIPKVQPSFGLIQSKEIKQTSSSIDLVAPKSQPNLFGSASKPLSLSPNFFQSNPPPQQTKKEQPPKVAQIAKPQLPKQQPVKPTLQLKPVEKEQKKVKAIGPGGQTIQLPQMFQTNKQVGFGSSPQKPSSNLFTSLGSSSSNNIFTQPSNNIFGQSSSNMFNSSTGPSAGGSLFGNSSSQLFGNSKPIFNNSQSALFGKQTKKADPEDEQDGNDDDDGPIVAEDDADPDLCVIKYDYIQTNVLFKEPANKFREGAKDTLDNTMVTIEQFQNSDSKYLYVRMPNKCITFCGKFVKKVTEIRVLNNNKKNIEIKKIMLSGENVKNVGLTFLKIQFKDEAAGQKFLKEVQKAIKEDTSS